MKNTEKEVNEIVNVNVTEPEVLTENDKGEAVEEALVVLPLYVVRSRVIGSDGRKFWNYRVEGSRNGRALKADLIPKDNGAWKDLDDIFEGNEKVLLNITNGTRDQGGKKVKYTSYSVSGVGDYGITYSVALKPREDSDTKTLTFFVEKARYEAEHPEVLQK